MDLKEQYTFIELLGLKLARVVNIHEHSCEDPKLEMSKIFCVYNLKSNSLL